MDVGEFIVPIPHVKQVKVALKTLQFGAVYISNVMSFLIIRHFFITMKLSSTGGRLIIASDGIWDALSSETAAKSCRGVPAELAARLVVKVLINL